MTFEDVQLAEIRIIRALRLVALALGDTMDDMCRITVQGNADTPADVVITQRLAWTRVSRLLRLTSGMLTAIHDNSGPADGISAQIVEDCGEQIKVLEERRRVASSQRFEKRITDEAAKMAGAPNGDAPKEPPANAN